ncbi:MAG: bifunctional (p)ppGpp synthetase/guanosine-3',5'-bis(diphosphate) 3'-pyrophosphohydrolase, partial [Myxococcales bacterium]|nr:bifunctional (p)ppGpp synthetase/guanosine-3',5'-bis(diphosphate) 3'-pyrophosphohydrolase [Myxococcales bacterium]
MSYSERYARALGIAARAHRDQVRKGKDVPYVTHPVHVARILDRHGFSEDLVLAGLLHDVLEDTAVSEQELLDAVGGEVVALVRAVTETKSEDGVERSWEVRKAEQAR